MHFIPGLRMRCSEEAEIIGVDDAEMGEFAYDYVGIEAELGMREEFGVHGGGGGREPDHHPSAHGHMHELGHDGERSDGSQTKRE